MSANIVNVVHKEGRQAGKKVGSLLFGPYIMPVFVRHATCLRCYLPQSKKLSQLIQQQQRVENRARAPKLQPPLCGALLLLWRHLNELQINFILVACASLRMEMMMDNNDATTGSPSPRPLRRPSASPR